MSLSATSLFFSRAVWGGLGYSSAVVVPVGSCFALQLSWIIFGVPSQCQILFHVTLHTSPCHLHNIVQYSSKAHVSHKFVHPHFTPGSKDNLSHSTLKVHTTTFQSSSWTHSPKKFFPWTFSHLLYIILHPYQQSIPCHFILTASVILSWEIYSIFASNSTTSQWFWLGALGVWCGGSIAGHAPTWGASVAL